MSRLRLVNPGSLPEPIGFNHGVLTGGPAGSRVLFVAGQIGCDHKGSMVSQDLAEQFEVALRNALAVVEEAGGRAEAITRMTVYVTDVAHYRAQLKGLGTAYRRVMGKHYPAMVVLQVQALFDPNAKIELEVTAVL